MSSNDQKLSPARETVPLIKCTWFSLKLCWWILKILLWRSVHVWRGESGGGGRPAGQLQAARESNPGQLQQQGRRSCRGHR